MGPLMRSGWTHESAGPENCVFTFVLGGASLCSSMEPLLLITQKPLSPNKRVDIIKDKGVFVSEYFIIKRLILAGLTCAEIFRWFWATQPKDANLSGRYLTFESCNHLANYETQYITKQVPIETLDYHYYLPLFFDGLKEASVFINKLILTVSHHFYMHSLSIHTSFCQPMALKTF